MFQSTRPHGARRMSTLKSIKDFKFQSTRPHGARPSIAYGSCKEIGRFNPRARTGRDSSPARISL